VPDLEIAAEVARLLVPELGENFRSDPHDVLDVETGLNALCTVYREYGV
jgi:hypothetical protein